MKYLVTASAIALHGLTCTASAETCVSTSFDRPFPGASGVETRLADVPSPRFPGVWQEGWVDGLFYRIWSNEEAVLQPERRQPAWTITVNCAGEDDSMPCREATEGTPPQAALEVAADLARCLTDPAFEGAASPPAAVPETVADAPPDATAASSVAEDASASPDCGLAALPEGPAGLTLQRMLVEAGADPGPLDGLPGPQTRRALADVLGTSAQQLETADAIAALDRLLCETAE